MSLIGTVDTLPLTDLFEVLAAARKTGALHVRSEQGLGIVYFNGGSVCGGEAGHRSGPLDDRESLVARIFDVCFELFRFEEAGFEFELDARPIWPSTESVKVSEILAETARRLAEWAEIRRTVPSLEARPRLVPDSPEDSIILEAAQWRIVAAIDGRRRISALIRVLDSSDFEVCARLASLVEGGLVALDAPDPATARPEVEDLTDVLPPVERRWAPARPSRLAAMLDNDHFGSEDAGSDELDNWDEQILATSGGIVRQTVREKTREATPEPADDADDAHDADDEDDDFPGLAPPTGGASSVEEDEESEILASS